MDVILAVILTPIGFVLCAVSGFLALEVLAAALAGVRRPPHVRARSPIAVVMPAHNESAVIGATVLALRAELGEADRFIVVADNCADDTAARAKQAGAEVVIRDDAARRGKGYALQFGVDALKASPPAAVIFVDADCRLEAGSLDRLAERAISEQRPVQGLYLMNPPNTARAPDLVSAFAWLFMNKVRMTGLQTLAGLTRLTGSGMAFPWRVLEKLQLASGEIVEDLALTVQCVEGGFAPTLEPSARISSSLAATDRGKIVQRSRWEHGSIATAVRHAPRLIMKGVSGDWRLLALGLDLAIPPISLFVAIVTLFWGAALFARILGADGPFIMAQLALPLVMISVAGGWLAFGRQVLPARRLAGVLGYALAKFRIYGREGGATTKTWTRTDRSGSS